MLALLLIRHGETDWNREGRVMGWRPVPLNDTGRGQIGRLAASLKGVRVEALYASPLQRTLETARILGDALGLSPTLDDRWIETKITGWEGQLWSELEGHPIRDRYYAAPTETRLPDGERLADVRDRVAAAAAELERRHPHAMIAVVSHADPIRAVVGHYIGLELSASHNFRIDHATATIVEIDRGIGTLRVLNAPPDMIRLP
ncbi:MAG TPA: histidine phosphatase family protein [Nitrospiria bacterium]|nr:histidine phosphatase family protein [Nitrospiria bacterium]